MFANKKDLSESVSCQSCQELLAVETLLSFGQKDCLPSSCGCASSVLRCGEWSQPPTPPLSDHSHTDDEGTREWPCPSPLVLNCPTPPSSAEEDSNDVHDGYHQHRLPRRPDVMTSNTISTHSKLAQVNVMSIIHHLHTF